MKTVKTWSASWPSVALLLVLLSIPATATAQRRDGTPDRERIEQRIRAQMGRMMQERLGLDESEAERLSEIVQSFDDRRRTMAMREFETRRRVEAAMEAGGNDAEARELLELQAQLRLDEAQLFRQEQEALLGVLTPSQVLELQDLRQDIGRRIRALRGGGSRDEPGRFRGPRPDGRTGAGPGGPPPPIG